MLVGHVLDVSSPQGRFAEGAVAIDGQRCIAVEAFGKHLVYRFVNGFALHIHLGLFGKFRSAKRPAAEPKGEVRVRMISTTHVVDINGPNTCEVLDAAELLALTSRIGPDVLRGDADPDKAWARISRSRVSIGQLLTDQSVLAGIGNIYRSEILWNYRASACVLATLRKGGITSMKKFLLVLVSLAATAIMASMWMCGSHRPILNRWQRRWCRRQNQE